MSEAGCRSQCGKNVWLSEDGQNDIAASPGLRRRWRLIGGLSSLGCLALCLCAAFAAIALVPQARKSAQVAGEWRARVARDYPGWSIAGFDVQSHLGPSGQETEYTFTLVPPKRGFTVGIVYVSDGGRAASQDNVFRSGARFGDRAKSLLDFIEREYVKQGKSVVLITSDANGGATLDWEKTRQLGPFWSREGDFDDLTYDEASGTWSREIGFDNGD